VRRSAVRVVLVREPTLLTSSKSRVYALLVSLSGPSERNCEASSSRNGRTSLTHAFGSLPKAGRTGFQTPGPEPTAKRNAPKRPSSVRAAIIAAAAASPTRIPRVFELPSGIAASEAAYCASRTACCAGTRCESILYAAAAAAAGFESIGCATRDVSR
jgi:ribosomal protein S30